MNKLIIILVACLLVGCIRTKVHPERVWSEDKETRVITTNKLDIWKLPYTYQYAPACDNKINNVIMVERRFIDFGIFSYDLSKKLDCGNLKEF